MKRSLRPELRQHLTEKMARTDLKDWAMTVAMGKACCESAQRNGADVVARAVLSIVGQILDQAVKAENRFLYLSFAPAVAVRGVALSPVVTAFPKLPPVGSLPAGAIFLAVGIELGNVYGRTVLLNALSDMSNAVTATLEQAQLEISRPGTGKKTKRGIFDCDRCVREKALQQHGSRLAVVGGEGKGKSPTATP